MNTTSFETKQITIKKVCIDFLFAYMVRDVDRMLSYCVPSGRIHFQPLGEGGVGEIAVLGKGLWSSLIDSFPDIENTVDAAIAEEENVVRCQVLISGTQEKDFAGIVSKGKHFDSDHIFIFHINQDNLIDDLKISWDHEDFVRQLS